MMLNHLNHREPRQFQFGESRNVRFLGFSAAGSAIKGMWDGVKGAPKQVAEKAGVARKVLDWFTTAKTVPGYVIFGLPIMTRKLVEGVVGGVKTVNEASYAVFNKIGEVIKKPVHDVVGLTRDLVGQSVKSAYGSTVKPTLEILKSTCIDFPMRALVDNFRTGLKTIFGTVGTFANSSLEAAKEVALSPLTVVSATREAVKEVLWNAPKALLKGELKESAKHIASGALNLGKGALKAPIAVASIPYHVGMELGLGGLETAMNSTKAFAAPVEGMVNAYRTIGKTSSETLEYLKAKLEIKKVGSYRERLKEIFSMPSPLAFASSPA